jgi:low affinity Fe/Cu permease
MRTEANFHDPITRVSARHSRNSYADYITIELTTARGALTMSFFMQESNSWDTGRRSLQLAGLEDLHAQLGEAIRSARENAPTDYVEA